MIVREPIPPRAPPGLRGKFAIDYTCLVRLEGRKIWLIFYRNVLPARPLVFLALLELSPPFIVMPMPLRDDPSVLKPTRSFTV